MLYLVFTKPVQKVPDARLASPETPEFTLVNEDVEGRA